jgi:hypothetical protein
MLAHEMNDPICLRKSLMRAKGTLEATSLIRVSGSNMNGQSLGMEKLLLTGWALKRKVALMGLQMIVHRVLILLYRLADATYKLSRSVLLIRVCHWLGCHCKACCINFSMLRLSRRDYHRFSQWLLWPPQQ